MREGREKGEGTSYYHCMSRIIHNKFLLGSPEKTQFHWLMRRVEGFCNVKILTYSLLDNHFHLLVKVPETETEIDDEELFRRMGFLYPSRHIERVAGKIGEARKEGREDLAEELRQQYIYRMHDVSEFMKTLKQRFTQWYNRRKDQTGTLWSSRYKSLIVEEWGAALSTVSAYIDLNPVRAGIVKDPKDYRFCGYGEALGGDERAREGLLELARISHRTPAVSADSTATAAQNDQVSDCGISIQRHRHLIDLHHTDSTLHALATKSGEKSGLALCNGPVQSQDEALAIYRRHLYVSDKERSISREEIEKVIAADGELAMHQLLACRIRYFSDGLVLGSREFVEEVCRRNRDRFGSRRKTGAHPLKYGQWGGLCSLRKLRKNPVALPT